MDPLARSTQGTTESGHWHGQRSLTPAPLERGLGDDPLSWEPRPPLPARLIRALSVPARAGIAVFLVVLAATAWIVLQGLGAGAAGLSDEPGGAGGTASVTDGAEGSLAPEDPGGSAHAPGTAGSGSGPGSESGAAGVAAGGATDGVLVHVVGEVSRPGVVELEPGARVLDAIEAAGGATELAMLDEMNLARRVVDGERILVPDEDTASELAAAGAPGADAGGAAAGGGTASGVAGGVHGGVVQLNTANAAALETLPRVGPALAARIIEWRDAHGGFTSVEQLLEVSGIGERTLAGLRDLVTV